MWWMPIPYPYGVLCSRRERTEYLCIILCPIIMYGQTNTSRGRERGMAGGARLCYGRNHTASPCRRRRAGIGIGCLCLCFGPDNTDTLNVDWCCRSRRRAGESHTQFSSAQMRPLVCVSSSSSSFPILICLNTPTTEISKRLLRNNTKAPNTVPAPIVLLHG